MLHHISMMVLYLLYAYVQERWGLDFIEKYFVGGFVPSLFVEDRGQRGTFKGDH